jgi:hypothetical protein
MAYNQYNNNYYQEYQDNYYNHYPAQSAGGWHSYDGHDYESGPGYNYPHPPSAYQSGRRYPAQWSTHDPAYDNSGYNEFSQPSYHQHRPPPPHTSFPHGGPTNGQYASGPPPGPHQQHPSAYNQQPIAHEQQGYPAGETNVAPTQAPQPIATASAQTFPVLGSTVGVANNSLASTGNRGWESRSASAMPARVVPIEEALRNHPPPTDDWLDLPITEEKVLVWKDIPASARLCKYYFAEKNERGCTWKPRCPYGHSPLWFNCVQLALIPNPQHFNMLMRIHNKREYNKRATTVLLTEDQVIRHADPLRDEWAAVRKAKVLEDPRYDGIDWLANARTRQNADNAGRDRTRTASDQGRPSTDNARATVPQQHGGKGRNDKKAEPEVKKVPTLNSDPERSFLQSTLGCEMVVQIYFASRHPKFTNLWSKEKRDDAAKAMKQLQKVALDISHPLCAESRAAIKKLSTMRDEFVHDCFIKEDDEQVKMIMNEDAFMKEMQALLVKLGLVPPEEEEAPPVDGTTTATDELDGTMAPSDAVLEPPGEVVGAPTREDCPDGAKDTSETAEFSIWEGFPKKKKKQKKGRKLTDAPAGPAQTPKTLPGRSVLPPPGTGSTKFDLYGTDEIDDAEPEVDDLERELTNANIAASEADQLPVDNDGFMVPKKSNKLASMSEQNKQKYHSGPSITKEQREALRALDAAAENGEVP